MEGQRTTSPFSANPHRIARLEYEAANPKKAKPKKPPEDTSWRDRWQQAHEQNFKEKFPSLYAIGEYIQPKYPDSRTANGLQNIIESYLNWLGYRCTRINVIGIRGRKSQTRKGTADLSSTIKGKSVMWEVKIGSDKPSPEQLKEQKKEERAGGKYYFVKTPNDFFYYFDSLCNAELFL